MSELEAALEGEQKKVVVLSPHPDDAVIGLGGTIKRLIDAGSFVKVLVITTGERGSPEAMRNPKVRQSLAGIRASEEDAAAKRLGYRSVKFGFSSAAYTKPIAEKIQAELESADIVFAPHTKDGHHTHVDVTRALLSLKSPVEAWGYEVWHPINNPDYIVDITNVVEDKINAINCHESQVKHKDFASAAKGLARYRGVFSKDYPKKGFEYAEVFVRLSG